MNLNQPWSRFQDKLFEQALVLVPDLTPNRWERIAAQVPGKSPSEIRRHYDVLVHDVAEIERGRVEVPEYGEDDEQGRSPPRVRAGAAAERRKGVAWTEEEHRRFLIGLERYGRGDWRSISRNAVVSRTPTQVASHAQKYFLRLSSVRKEKEKKKRSSIHDVSVNITNIA